VRTATVPKLQEGDELTIRLTEGEAKILSEGCGNWPYW
jgi:hypothetical protein